MSLGNLSVSVGADISDYSSSMDRAAQIARDRMGQSAGSVDDFRGSFLRASDDMQKASALMGSAMQAANDAIMASSAQSSAAIQGISDTAGKATFSSMSERVAEAIGTGVTTGIVMGSQAWDDFKEKSSTAATVAGLAIGAVLAGTIAGAIYTGYKVLSTTISAISGMMDGSFYKSENIDSLIATNDQLVKMQENFRISSIEAGALAEAMKRLKVDPGDYKAVYDGIDQAIHGNGEELDRLGVKYRSADGQFLDHTKILQNAKDVLDTYTEGWDRNQAAAAMGMGSYAQIVQTLKVTSAEIQVSKERLDEYQLGMSAGAEEAVAKYKKAMDEFNAESDLMSRGFKRAIADAVMPAFTDLANLFKDGWPSIVRAFRVGTSTIAGLGYVMADGFYIVAQSVMASLGVLNDAVNAISTAGTRLATGNISGAGDALAAGWEKATGRIKNAGDNIVKQVMENDAKIKLATAADGRSASIEDSKINLKPTGRSWNPKPAEVKQSAINSASERMRQDPFQAAQNDVERSQQGMNFVLDNFDKFQGKVKESKEAMAQFDVTMGRFSDKQRAAAGFSPLSDSQKQAFIEENRQLDITAEKLKTQSALREIDKSTAAFGFQEKQALDFRKQDVDWMGKSALELAKLTEARRIDGAAAAQIQAAQAKLGKDEVLPQAKIDKINAVATASKQAAADLIDQADSKSKDPYFNFTESIRKYGEEANNVGAQVGNALTNGFKSAEDAIVSFATTGKLSFSSFAQSVLADMARMQAKNFLASLTGNGNSSSFAGALGSGLFNSLSGLFGTSTTAPIVTNGWQSAEGGLSYSGRGFADGGNPPLNVASMVGERGPELFVPKGAGTIIPNDQLRGGGGSNVTINQTNHIDSRTDMAQIQQMLA
ncbi:MAG: phage tail tape measure C-terminal domain-containing protein, partial [Janthinobacterium lividum]